MTRYDAVNFITHGVAKDPAYQFDRPNRTSARGKNSRPKVAVRPPKEDTVLLRTSSIWLVQYRYENERAFEAEMRPGMLKSWKVSPYAPDRVTREARENDLVVIWRTLDRQTPNTRPRSRGGIVGWGRLRLSGRAATSPTISFEITSAFPNQPLDRGDVHRALDLDKSAAARWPGMVSLRRLEGAEAATIASLQPLERVISRSHHPLASGIPPDWASGWGEDENGVFIEITVDDVTQALRWCPPGRFMMGSSEDEPARFSDKGPQTEITFEQGFWLFETPVTQALYEAVTGGSPSRFKGSQRPVERVGFADALNFLDSINGAHPGLELRLPSEAEWEYACRAGSATPFESNVARTHAGASIVSDEVNHRSDQSYVDAAQGEYRKETVNVKHRPFRPNAWGLWQMHGNVFEWCADVWRDPHSGASPDGTAQPAFQQVGAVDRVIRGGSWNYDAGSCRSAYRFKVASVHRDGDLGFRPARGQVTGTLASKQQKAERFVEAGKAELPAEVAGVVALKQAVQKWLSAKNDGRTAIQSAITGQVEAIIPDVEANATSGSVELSPWAPELRSIDWPEGEHITLTQIDAIESKVVKAV
ncbi:MAG: formylglycine-generating enzyme family protein, partial [Alphaproteobacteria bacterium]|nr:formylglycine-generating enzyme family protein [Alphaproteobacteria bacterium]